KLDRLISVILRLHGGAFCAGQAAEIQQCGNLLRLVSKISRPVELTRKLFTCICELARSLQQQTSLAEHFCLAFGVTRSAEQLLRFVQRARGGGDILLPAINDPSPEISGRVLAIELNCFEIIFQRFVVLIVSLISTPEIDESLRFFGGKVGNRLVGLDSARQIS